MKAITNHSLPQEDKITPLQSHPMLSGEQVRAIGLLCLGKTVSATAALVGRSSDTVSRWKNENPYFMSELNRRQTELSDAVNKRIQCLVSKAVNVIEAKIDEGNLRAAIEILRTVNLQSHMIMPDQETDPDRLVIRRAEEIAIRQVYHDPFSDTQLKGAAKNSYVKALASDIAQLLRNQYKVDDTELLSLYETNTAVDPDKP